MKAIPENNRKFLWGIGAYGGISPVAQASSPVPRLRAHTGMGAGGDAGATIIPVQTYALRFTHPHGHFWLPQLIFTTYYHAPETASRAHPLRRARGDADVCAARAVGANQRTTRRVC